MALDTAPGRALYLDFEVMDTRWADDDVYGHVNNVAYYAFFDTAVNRRLIRLGALDPHGGAVIGLVVETRCRYFAPVGFPDRVCVGLRVERLGTTSVTYDLGLFRNDEDRASARGSFTHVFVDRATRRPTPMPAPLREALSVLFSP